MKFITVIARAFAMSDGVWERHASGWSVWSRVATGPLFPFALLSHIWVGWGWALIMMGALGVWLWLNPRLFSRPGTTKSWHSKVVLGERVWLNSAELPIPPHHSMAAIILSSLSGIGAIIALGGALLGAFWPTALGTTVMTLGKLWFGDRMVWLFEDMKDAAPQYRAWLY